MKYKKHFLAILLVSNINTYAFASALDGADTVSDYLMISTEQQEIALRRYLNANPSIANQCTPNWSIEKSNKYFITWIETHPQFLRRGLTSAFTTALLDACKK